MYIYICICICMCLRTCTRTSEPSMRYTHGFMKFSALVISSVHVHFITCFSPPSLLCVLFSHSLLLPLTFYNIYIYMYIVMCMLLNR